ncbi:BadF/BadG/BcrA/BcrD ATPase family protein [Cellulosimicrobium sp. PMB13]|uniref:N-acetylglucosamine kinase n=1 Tax=Cellulosimicrobium sp. PMB13 TaxID=3120158 RepID=UPI003F4B0E46
MPTPARDAAWIVALDVGGSGSRLVARRPTAALAGAGASPDDVVLAGRPVAIRPDGSDAVDVVRELLARLRDDAPHVTGVVAAVAGVTGLATLVRDPAELHAALRENLAASGAATAPAPFRSAVAADALTAHLGALGGRGGAVVAVGTGAIALGTDLRTTWQRVDGWGHLLGDLGAGSWIGAQGLRAAVAAHDGRANGASAGLLDAATARFGPVQEWPVQLYTRADRAQVLASFTPDVAGAAGAGDAVARQILAGAGTHLATTLAAAVVDGVPPLAAATGGVLTIGPLLTGPFRARLAVLRPDVELVEPSGTPLDGALLLAGRLVRDPGDVVGHAPWLTVSGVARAAPPPEPPAAPRTAPHADLTEEEPDGR